MDLNQIRLNKTEWDSIEIPIREEEMRVVKMIMAGYSDLNIKTNRNILSRVLPPDANRHRESRRSSIQGVF